MEGYSSYGTGQTKEQDFPKLTKTIETSIQKISQNVVSMQRMVDQIGSHQDSPELRKQLHSIQHYTQQLVKDTNGYLKDLSHVPASLSHSEQRQRKMLRERLQDELISIINSFQNVQKNIASKEKDQINKTKAQHHYNDFNLGKPTSRRDQQLIELQESDQNQRQMQLQEEEDLRELQEQEELVRQLENDIYDVNKIFKDLGVLVHEQGELVDSIEANIESTEHRVREGAQQLSQASQYKNKVRRKKLYCAIIGAAILALIILIIVWQTSNN